MTEVVYVLVISGNGNIKQGGKIIKWQVLLKKIVREYQQKTSSHSADFGYQEGRVQGESVKKGDFVTKIFFSDNVE